MRELIDLGLRGVKVHPPHQLVAVNDYRDRLPHQAEIYEECQRAGLPVMIHTGTSIFPGARNRFASCMPVDDLALDFVNIIMAHGGGLACRRPSSCASARRVHIESQHTARPLLDYFPRLRRSYKVFGAPIGQARCPRPAGNLRGYSPASSGESAQNFYDNAHDSRYDALP
jgi:hypothetical protein